MIKKVHRELKVIPVTFSIIDFIEKILPVTVRDTSVQRESVWNDAKKKGYVTSATIGSAFYTSIHLCDLKKLLECAEDARDWSFVELLKGVIEEGYVYAHLDGGNRCDSFIDLYEGKVTLSDGDYRFQDGFKEYVKDTSSFINEYEEDDKGNLVLVGKNAYEKLKDKHPKLVERFEQQKVVVMVFCDLTQSERANLFKMLNDGVNLNAAEHRNPSLELICVDIRENLNEKYKDVSVEVGAITVDKTIRFGFCEFLGKLALLHASEDEVPTIAGKSDLDNAYVDTTQFKKKEYKKFKTFFEKTVVPYLNMMVKEDYVFASQTFYDFFVFLKNLENGGYKLKTISNASRKVLFDKWYELLMNKLADTTTMFEIKVGENRNFTALFKKNVSATTKIRFAFQNDEVIPALVDAKLVVKKDPTRLFGDMKPALWLQQGGITSDGVQIPAGQVFNADIFSGDHSIIPHAKGGLTDVENGKLETVDFNKRKGAKVKKVDA